MFGLQPTHVLIIVVIALIFFGPNRLPDLARSIGKSMREFQDALKEGAQNPSAEIKAPSTDKPVSPTQESNSHQ
jgi:sec-independent protein translocase protein TatA